MAKIDSYCLREARKDKAWAKRTAKDKAWFKRASDMSKNMLMENLKKSVSTLAREKCSYLKMRACAKGNYYGTPGFIDEPARAMYKKITGKYPSCRIKK